MEVVCVRRETKEINSPKPHRKSEQDRMPEDRLSTTLIQRGWVKRSILVECIKLCNWLGIPFPFPFLRSYSLSSTPLTSFLLILTLALFNLSPCDVSCGLFRCGDARPGGAQSLRHRWEDSGRVDQQERDQAQRSGWGAQFPAPKPQVKFTRCSLSYACMISHLA